MRSIAGSEENRLAERNEIACVERRPGDSQVN
jgi:hypothetical protein